MLLACVGGRDSGKDAVSLDVIRDLSPLLAGAIQHVPSDCQWPAWTEPCLLTRVTPVRGQHGVLLMRKHRQRLKVWRRKTDFLLFSFFLFYFEAGCWIQLTSKQLQSLTLEKYSEGQSSLESDSVSEFALKRWKVRVTNPKHEHKTVAQTNVNTDTLKKWVRALHCCGNSPHLQCPEGAQLTDIPK